MNPIYFGQTEHQLYGVYHPAMATKTPRACGIVLCYPFGQEYMRAHRAFRQIAVSLAKNGFHVLRFDYRGTGDSSGDLEDSTAANWLEDINTAVDELKSITGLDRFSLIGLRLGGLLAALAPAKRSDIDSVVLWDPVSSGSAYRKELTEEVKSGQGPDWNSIDENGTLHFNGFSLTEGFLDSLDDIQLDTQLQEIRKGLLVVSHENDSSRLIRETCENHPGFTYKYIEAPGDWNYVDDFGGILLPQPVMQGIVHWISSE